MEQNKRQSPSFGLWDASALSNEEIAQSYVKGQYIATSPKPLLVMFYEHNQRTIKKLELENKSLREDKSMLAEQIRSNCEDMQSLKSETEQEKAVTKAIINMLQKDFQVERESFQEQSKEQQKEITDLKTKQSAAQSLSDCKEEELKEMKNECRKQVNQIASLEEDLHNQGEENFVRISAIKDQFQEVISIKEVNAAKKLKETFENWQMKVKELDQQVKQAKVKVGEEKFRLERQIVTLEESIRIQAEDICVMKEHYEEVIRVKEGDADKQLRECEEKWQMKVRQLDQQVKQVKVKDGEERIRLERQIVTLQESVRNQAEDMCVMKEHYEEVIRVKEGDANKQLRECEEKWQMKVRQLEGAPCEVRASMEKEMSSEDSPPVLADEDAATLSEKEDNCGEKSTAKQQEEEDLNGGETPTGKEPSLLEESLRLLREESAARLSAAEQSHKEMLRLTEETATHKLNACEDVWQVTVKQLKEKLQLAKRELYSLNNHMKNQVFTLEQSLYFQREMCARRLDDAKERYEETTRLLEENADTKLRECNGRWQVRVEQLAEDMQVIVREANEGKAQMEREIFTLQVCLSILRDVKAKGCSDTGSDCEDGDASELQKDSTEIARQMDLVEETQRLLREEYATKISDMEKHHREVVSLTEQNAADRLRDCEEKWQMRMAQLELYEGNTQLEIDSNRDESLMMEENAEKLSLEGADLGEITGSKARDDGEKLRMKVTKLELELKVCRRELTECREQAASEIASLKEALRIQESMSELHDEGRKQLEREIASHEDSLRILRGENAAKLAVMEERYKEVLTLKEEHAAQKLRDRDEKWQITEKQLKELLKISKREVIDLRNHMKSEIFTLETCMSHQYEASSDFRDVMKLRDQVAASKLKECEENSQMRVKQLEEELETSKKEFDECKAGMETAIESLQESLCLLSVENAALKIGKSLDQPRPADFHP